MTDQIYEFTRILEDTFYNSRFRLQEPTTWTKAFELLTNTIKSENPKGITVLFFDELPWLASQKSGFTRALDYYWNRFWVNIGELLTEFDILYSSLFSNPASYEEIIRAISSKREGIDRKTLLEKLKLSVEGGSFNKKLRALETSGFISSFKPYGNIKKGTYYRIIDEYTLFYLEWVEPHLSTIQKIKKADSYWLECFKTPRWNSWAGYAFESICLKHIEQIKRTLKINASAEIGNWRYIPRKTEREDGAQIDLLFDRNDQVITICEIKYSQKPYKLSKQDFRALIRKSDIFKKKTGIKKQICIALISPLGVEDTLYTDELVGIVTLKDLLT